MFQINEGDFVEYQGMGWIVRTIEDFGDEILCDLINADSEAYEVPINELKLIAKENGGVITMPTEGKHNAIFLGRKVRKLYFANKGQIPMIGKPIPPYISETYVLMEYVKITETQIDNPALMKGERIYINEYDAVSEILDVMRSTDNKYIYYLDYNIEIVEDEETEKSKIEAEKYLAMYEEEYEKKLEEKENGKILNLIK
jgi:hypothetical protein